MTNSRRRGPWGRRIGAIVAGIALLWLLGAMAMSVPKADAQANVLWSGTMEAGNLSEWSVGGGGGIFNSGTGTAVASTDVAHGGRYSAKMTITNASGTSQAVRLFRWAEPRANSSAYYSAWFYFPQRYSGMSWWNVWQWKSKLPNGANDPLWILNVGNRSDGQMSFYLYDWINRRSYNQSAVAIPVGRWFHVEAYYRQATDNTGQITFWQDGVQILNVTGVATKRSGDETHWSINNYTDRISPSTATVYVDDAAISSSRMGPGGNTPAPTATTKPVTATPVATSVPVTATPVATSVPATPAPGSGKNYYVDSLSGSDSNNGTSPSSAWKTLSAVQSRTFSPGDTINFRRGASWNGGLTIRSSGVDGKPITFRAYGTGARPVISNSGARSGSAVRIESDYVVVQDFLARDAHEAGIYIASGADHNVVRDNEITNAGTGVFVKGQYNLVTGNYAHDLRMITNTSGGDDDWGATGIWIEGSNTEVSYNRMINCRAPSYDYGYDGGAVELYGQVSNANIHHNYSRGSNGFIEVGGGSARNITIAYNVSDRDYSAFTMLHLSGNFASAVSNFKVENNTIVKTTKEWKVLDFGGEPSPSTYIFRNNVVYTQTGVSNRSNFTHTNNLYYLYNGATLGFSLGPGEKQGDPLFVNMGSGDYHLRSGSPAIDAGASLGYNRDFDGAAVPAGRAPDMGAFEYSGVVPAAPSPTPTKVPATPTPTASPTSVPTSVPTTVPTATPTQPPAATSSPTPSPTSVPSGGQELLGNGGFESDLSKWDLPPWFAKAVGVTRSPVHSGSKALAFEGKSNGAYVQQEVSASPGQKVNLSGWVNVTRRDGASSMIVELVARHQHNGDLKVFPIAVVSDTTDGWIQIGGSAIMPDRTARVRVRIRFPSLNGAFYLDDLSLR